VFPFSVEGCERTIFYLLVNFQIILEMREDKDRIDDNTSFHKLLYQEFKSLVSFFESQKWGWRTKSSMVEKKNQRDWKIEHGLNYVVCKWFWQSKS